MFDFFVSNKIKLVADQLIFQASELVAAISYMEDDELSKYLDNAERFNDVRRNHSMFSFCLIKNPHFTFTASALNTIFGNISGRPLRKIDVIGCAEFRGFGLVTSMNRALWSATSRNQGEFTSPTQATKQLVSLLESKHAIPDAEKQIRRLRT